MSSAETQQMPHDLEAEVREQALERLKKRRDLGAHLVSYLIINAALWGVWALTGAGYAWPVWVTGGWAIGLALNAWDVYGRRPITETDIRREMDRLRVSADARRS
jgi:hypothetical protein